MAEHVLTVIGIIVTMGGIILAFSLRLYLSNRTKNTITDVSSGVTANELKHINDELEHLHEYIERVEADTVKNHELYDTIQLQISKLRERLARIEGPN